MMDFIHRFFRIKSLKAHLRFWSIFIVLFMGFLIIVPQAFVEQQYIKDQKIKELQQFIDLQRLFIERWMKEKAFSIQNLANSECTKSLNKEKILNSLFLFINCQEDFEAVVYVNASGITELDTTRNKSTDISDRQYFIEAKKGNNFITDILISRISGKPIIIFSSPVFDDKGVFQGLILGSVNIATIEQIMKEFEVETSGETYLMTREGQRITEPRQTGKNNQGNVYLGDEIKADISILEAALKGEKNLTVYNNYKGEEVFGTYQWINNNKWLIIGKVNKKEVMRPFYNLIVTLVILVLLVIILAGFIMRKISSKIEFPIERLLFASQFINKGNYDYMIEDDFIKTAPLELQVLCNMYNEMSNKLKKNINLLEESAIKDQLTGIYNRRFLMQEGKKIFEACLRGNQPCSALVIDIDYFKKVNDTYGHLIGDKVLKHIATIINTSVRNSDIAVRYGGEEFVVVTTNSNADDSSKLAERIRVTVEQNPFEEENIVLHCTVSIGVAQHTNELSYGTNALEDVLERADNAMYQAKQKGRNCVVMVK